MLFDNFTLPLKAVPFLNANSHSYGMWIRHNAQCLATAKGFFSLQIQFERVII